MDNNRILVTGAEGQLGIDLVKELQSKHFEVYGFGRKGLDITDSAQVQKTLNEIKPSVVIHSAAYTKVDLAESEEEAAYLVNAYGTRNIAVASQDINAKLVFVSTDYVFDGCASQPYHEFYPTNPVSIYGKSKLAGEQFVKSLHAKYFIVRTSWVYGLHGQNFVKTMLKLAQERNSISVVMDQVGSPTYTSDLAACISNLMMSSKYGVYHVTNSGQCSWYELAKTIFEEANIQINVEPVTTDAFPRPARRPAYSVMDQRALRLNGFGEMRHWRDALSKCIEELKISTSV